MPISQKEFVGLDFDEALSKLRGSDVRASDFYALPKPEELHALYSRGYQGIRPDSLTFEEKALYKDFMASMPRLYDVFPWAKDLGKGKLCVPYVACTKLIEGWGGLFPQVQGDCTVHGNGHAAEIDYCNDCLWGESKFYGPIAFENVYRSRGFNGDGWSCQAPAYYVGPEGKGGFLYRKVYEGPNGETVDLTKYNSAWQSNGRAGVPSWLEEISRRNKAKWVIPIRTPEEYRDCHAMGFGINFCSGLAYSSETDEFGVAQQRGSWSHAMGHIGSDDRPWAHQKYGGMLGLPQNSWGNWNRRNGQPEGAPPLPVGGLWCRMSQMVRAFDGDQIAICSVYGWDRTGWEAFDAGSLLDHMKNSTTQDYYKQRSERIAEASAKAAEEFMAL